MAEIPMCYVINSNNTTKGLTQPGEIYSVPGSKAH